MVEEILNAVTKQLGTAFGNNYRYYVEDIEQGLQRPCFHVMCTIPTMRSKSMVLYDRRMPIVILYFSDSKDKKKDCYAMGELIAECVEYLPFNDTLLRGENIGWQILENDVLQLFVTYNFTTKKVSGQVTDMEDFEENILSQQ